MEQNKTIDKNIGGRPKKLTENKEMKVYKMHKIGTPIAEIAYKFKISPSTVQRTVNRIKAKKEEI